MNYGDMKSLLEYYVDDVVDTSTATLLFNAGKDKMALAVHAKFPNITAVAPNDEFVFDSRFHELPVLYASAMVKSYDSSLQEKNNYMGQFETALRDFVQNYDPPVQYLVGEYMQHVKVTDLAGTSNVPITNPTFNTYGDVDVFVNSSPVGFRVGSAVVVLNSLAPYESVITVTWTPNVYDAQPWMKAW